MASNRLPFERVSDGPDNRALWRASPGGLISALQPVISRSGGAWVGWSGEVDEGAAVSSRPAGVHPEAGGGGQARAGPTVDPWDNTGQLRVPGPADQASPARLPGLSETGGVHLLPVTLSEDEVECYYEGFCNATLWPLYHDVIAPPVYSRRWWHCYVEINQRFADAILSYAAQGGTVWVHDYHLQLVPAMLREARPDLRIGFFNHIPFPPHDLFAQLPWRREIIEGLVGAHLIGFQRREGAANFLRVCRRFAGYATQGSMIFSRGRDSSLGHVSRAGTFPISVDAPMLSTLARSPGVQERAKQIREEVGNPDLMLLGVDRLDYTKGILHRLRAYGELLKEGELGPPHAVLVQIASPSRGNVEQYRLIREELERMVGQVNGDFSSVGHPAVHYLHQSFPKEEMAAMYLAADVALVTPLRDGMNLVAKEYVACRYDDAGRLVLSEFTGAADELTEAFMVNPHDIDSLKTQIMAAVTASGKEAERRMSRMRRKVFEHDVHRWAAEFLGALDLSYREQLQPESGLPLYPDAEEAISVF
ncbi:MAG TPA: trehalose-6-phosphate synthase [Acidimicrobiales bacterium]|nr:trehalose-6-phosphate synthase [Acidimicrobiales bacterium]